MAELWGGILRGLGAALAGIYSVIPSYGVAIILLTMAVRALMIPLTIKQIRSMTAMQKIQPELKKLQQKHKGDRQKLNEEIMKLYKEHGVNPLGGCLPLLAQTPVFIALYSVLRASIIVIPTTVLLIAASGTQESVPADLYSEKEAKEIICVPQTEPAVTGGSPERVLCERTDRQGEEVLLQVSDFRTPENEPVDAAFISLCRPNVTTVNEEQQFQLACGSRFGTGHLPRNSDLFRDLTENDAPFLGMHLGCSLNQAQSKSRVRECTTAPSAGGATAAIPYYILIGLVVGTTYYQSRQMAKRATGQAAQQQQIMTRVMPVVIGLISISFPAGVAVYWVTTNLWTIGQQALILRKQPPPLDADEPAPAKEKPAPEPRTKPKGPQPGKKKRK